jgi:hypothetical protein
LSDKAILKTDHSEPNMNVPAIQEERGRRSYMSDNFWFWSVHNRTAGWLLTRRNDCSFQIIPPTPAYCHDKGQALIAMDAIETDLLKIPLPRPYEIDSQCGATRLRHDVTQQSDLFSHDIHTRIPDSSRNLRSRDIFATRLSLRGYTQRPDE